MPKYSFKSNLFFAIWGGLVTDSGLPNTPHMHYVGHTTHCVGRTMHCVSRTTHFVGCTVLRVGRTEYDKKYLVNIKIFLSVLAFSRVKK